MTVAGLKMARAERQSFQIPDSHAQKTRSAAVSRGRFRVERSARQSVGVAPESPAEVRPAFETWKAARREMRTGR